MSKNDNVSGAGVPTKKCFKCLVDKPLTQFYAHPQMGDGHLGKCKECTRADVRKHRKDSPRPREYDAERYKNDPKRRSAMAARLPQYRKDNPEKTRAHRAVERAKARDDLVKAPCEVCGDKNAHAHHDDYSKPLEVRWLCPLHHARHHATRDS